MTQWTVELNDLLNQCVFECGYEFTDACRLLQSRARTLRLIPEGANALTADSCQVQWMTINPMDDEENEGKGRDECSEEDDGRYYGNLSLHQHVLEEMQFLREISVASSSYAMMSSSQQERGRAPMDEEGISPPVQSQAAAATDPTPAPSFGRVTSSSTSAMHPAAPLLELSISDAELDLLISSLPMPSPECDDDDDISDSKSGTERRATSSGTSSEMQWVLSFLTNPDDAARHDAEAKCLLETVEKHDDDNYQYFLRELSQANLLMTGNATSPELEDATGILTVAQRDRDTAGDEQASANASKSLESDAAQGLARLRVRVDAHNECREAEALEVCDSADDPADSDDDDDGDWEIVRQSMKTQAARPGTSSIVSRSSVLSQEMRAPNDDSPPPAPLMGSSRGGSENFDLANSGHHSQKNHRVALSQEIGDLLKTHGEFQFPRHMFPHHNDALELDLES